MSVWAATDRVRAAWEQANPGPWPVTIRSTDGAEYGAEFENGPAAHAWARNAMKEGAEINHMDGLKRFLPVYQIREIASPELRRPPQKESAA